MINLLHYIFKIGVAFDILPTNYVCLDRIISEDTSSFNNFIICVYFLYRY